MTPETLGRYAIKAELGRGSMGVVYRGHDPVIDRAVAIKTVSIPEGVSDAEREAFLTRFFQEARTAGKLLHPNIVVTYDAATDESTGTPFIAMELVEGETLATRLRAAPPVSWQQSLEWCAAIARALDHAHRHGVIHRDIKPANVMLTPLGVPKLADFGIAKLAAANLTATGIVMGTPYFMSPEQVEGKQLDGRSDLFTLGALVYTLVTGERPFEGRELASIAAQILYKNPNPPSELRPELPASLDGVVARALMKSPTDRYATGEELAAELDAVRQGRAPARPATVGESTRASVAVATAFQRVESAPDGAASTASTPSTVDAPRPLSTYPKRRLVAAAGALAGC